MTEEFKVHDFSSIQDYREFMEQQDTGKIMIANLQTYFEPNVLNGWARVLLTLKIRP